MLLYLDDALANHRTGSHPECPARIERVNQALRELDEFQHCEKAEWQEATLEQIRRNHTRDYVANLEHWCESEAGRIEADTVVCGASWKTTLRACGAACDAVHRILKDEHKQAFCALRPPGHHAKPHGAMGFCLFNTIAVAAHEALAQGLDRVMIIDWDVHHGNGTQDSFYEHGQIGFYSIHRSPFYPGTGAESETGSGDGLGCIANSPVPADVTKKEFFDQFERGIEQIARKINPQLILLSAGFDAHRKDPVGGLCMEEEDFAQLTRTTCQLADSYCDGRLVSLLEGGYHLDYLPKCVTEHFKALEQHSRR